MREFEDPPRLVETPDAPFALRSLLEQAYAEGPDPSDIEQLVQAVERRMGPFGRASALATRPTLFKLAVGVVGIGGGLWLFSATHSSPGASNVLDSSGTATQAGQAIAVPLAARDSATPMTLAGDPLAGLRGEPHAKTLAAGRDDVASAAGATPFGRTAGGGTTECTGIAAECDRGSGALAALDDQTNTAAGDKSSAPEGDHATGHARGERRGKRGRATHGLLATTPIGSPAASAALEESVLPDGEEYKLLRSARGALSTDPSRALTLTDEHKRRFSGGMLSQEREAIAIEALARVGRRAEAATRLARFARQFPNSPYRGRLEGMLHETNQAP